MSDGRRALLQLARRHQVATSYVDQAGDRRAPPPEALLGVLQALGVAIDAPGDAPAVLAAEQADAERASSARPGPPAVTVAWDGRLADGATLPFGVHELEGPAGRRYVIAAPRRASAPPGWARGGWGVFAAAYSIRDDRRRGAGDLTSLRRLGELAASHGAEVVATLPMLAELATADGGAPGQSPYAPLSRMWWNEAYLDLSRLPEATGSPPRRQGAAGRADLAAVASAIRPALDDAARRLEAGDSERRRDFRRYQREQPGLRRYAAFRAAIEARGPDLASWPAGWRAGRLPPAALPAGAVLRHSYAQWAMNGQLGEDSAALARLGCGYLLDLPVGCSPHGFDPWAYAQAFATGASIGSPPDTFFPEGQNWGFPPPHPEGDRALGYPMLRASLAQGLRHAAALRVDHVLGWSRLWWVPAGMPATWGAYVRYHLDELLAIACLESHLAGARLIGEDLGTVEPALQQALRRHDVAGMRVAVFDLDAEPEAAMDPPASSVAYLDTHDTATFAGWLSGADIDLRQSLRLLTEPQAAAERKRRGATRRRLLARLGVRPRSRDALRDALLAVLDELGQSEAELVLLNLEDLWGETDPHNVPGTTSEHLNFARRLARSLDQLANDGEVTAALDRLDAARRKAAEQRAGGAREPRRNAGERGRQR